MNNQHHILPEATPQTLPADLQEYFQTELNRLKTFSRWPQTLVQTPETLSEAGFYHLPTEEKPDRVKCAYCRGKLYNWQEDDDPWIQHARCFPSCPYVELCMGKDVVRELCENEGHVVPADKFVTQQQHRTQASTLLPNIYLSRSIKVESPCPRRRISILEGFQVQIVSRDLNSLTTAFALIVACKKCIGQKIASEQIPAPVDAQQPDLHILNARLQSYPELGSISDGTEIEVTIRDPDSLAIDFKLIVSCEKCKTANR